MAFNSRGLTALLRDADPVREGDELSAAEASALRREVLSAITGPAPVFAPWQRPMALASVVALIMAVSGIAGHRLTQAARTTGDRAPAVPPVAPAVADVDCRQLQFATPGGTRIIWVFDPNLRLQESMP
jgi:hypothetical protein